MFRGMKVTALAGGVGGAKLLVGLQEAAGADLTAIVNTGDDVVTLRLRATKWGAYAPGLVFVRAYGALLTRLLEADAPPGMLLARLSFDLWRPVTRVSVTGLPAVTPCGSISRHEYR